MSWLTPLTAAITGGIAIPALVLMYFLKLRRHEHVISSTLLWRRAVRDLQVNAPFQRLRRNILLFLQLLLLIAILLALAGPVMSLRSQTGKRKVILIDCSASMNATDVPGTRLNQAREKAHEIIDSMSVGGLFDSSSSSDQIMVIAFSDRAKVMCNFTSDKRTLKAAIDSIEPTDGNTAIAEAFKVAQAFAQSAGVAENNRSAINQADVLLFSDGNISDLDDLDISSGGLEYYRIAEKSSNVSVTNIHGSRSVENPEQVDIFVILSNWSDAPASTRIQLLVNGAIREAPDVKIPAANEKDSLVTPGKLSVKFSLTQPNGAIIEVRKLGSDSLPSDDAAWMVLDQPRDAKVLLVTDGNPLLPKALRSCPLAAMDQVSPDEFETMEKGQFAGPDKYDMVILDNCSPNLTDETLPRCAYLVFGRPADAFGVKSKHISRNHIVVDWRMRHPVLQHVNLDNLITSSACRMNLPAGANVLAEFSDTPAIAMIRKHGFATLLVGFDPMESNWPFQVGFVMFIQNAVSYLARQADASHETSIPVGRAIAFRSPSTTDAKITGPGISTTKIGSDSSGMIRWPETRRAGLYTVDIEDKPSLKFAVNFADAREGDITPRDSLKITGMTVQASSNEPIRENRPLWPVLAVIALSLVMLEWFVYNSRIRL